MILIADTRSRETWLEFRNAADSLKNDDEIGFGVINCTEMENLCIGFSTLPAIVYFSFGDMKRVYEGKLKQNKFIKFIENPMDENAFVNNPSENWEDTPGYENVSFLDDLTFFEFIKTKAKILVMFYEPLCDHRLVYFLSYLNV